MFVLVTGATGLVGSHLAADLLQKGYQVRALKRKTSDVTLVKKVISYYYENPEELFRKITWVEGDLLQYDEVYDMVEEVDHIYHTAGFVSFNPKHRTSMMRVNIEGTKNLINAALEHKVTKFCYVSSVAALGSPDQDEAYVTEKTMFDHASKSISGYAISKFYGEMEVWRGIAEGINATIVNPSVILGPGNWETGSGSIFSTIWKGFPYYPGGITGFVDVRDVSRAMIQLMEHEAFGERYIVSTENWSYQALFSKISHYLGLQQSVKKAPKAIAELLWRWEMTKYRLTGIKPLLTKDMVRSSYSNTYFSNEKIKKELSFEFISLETAIKDTCRLFLSEYS